MFDYDNFLGRRFSLREGLVLHVFYFVAFDRSLDRVFLQPVSGGPRQPVPSTAFDAGLLTGDVEEI